MAVWHPDAKRVPYTDAGPYIKCPPKIVWHTTETRGLPIYSGSAPHFTFNPKTGSLWQHIPLNRSAKSLEHPAGTVETNHANCIQVELLGYAKDTPNWPAEDYARIAKLARWIEVNHGVPSRCGVTFTNGTPHLSPTAWLNYTGHCGHQHVPSNHHWDPGMFKIELVLASESGSARRKRLWKKRLREALKTDATLHARIEKLKKLIAR